MTPGQREYHRRITIRQAWALVYLGLRGTARDVISQFKAFSLTDQSDLLEAANREIARKRRNGVLPPPPSGKRARRSVFYDQQRKLRHYMRQR